MKSETNEFQVGDMVKAGSTLFTPADCESPGGCLCDKGDVLVIRSIASEKSIWDYYVSHPEITDNAFGVTCTEIEKAQQ